LTEDQIKDLSERLFAERLLCAEQFEINDSFEQEITENQIDYVFVFDPFYTAQSKQVNVDFINKLRVLSQKHHLSVLTFVNYPISKVKKKHIKKHPYMMDWKEFHWLFPYYDQIFSLHSPKEYYEKSEAENIYFRTEKNVFSKYHKEMELSSSLKDGKVEILKYPDSSGMEFEFDTNITNPDTEALAPF
jgi:hypothetical protein